MILERPKYTLIIRRPPSPQTEKVRSWKEVLLAPVPVICEAPRGTKPLQVSAVARTGRQPSEKVENLRKGADVLLQSARRMGSTHPSVPKFLKASEEAMEAAAIATAVAMSGATDATVLHVAAQAEKELISAVAAQNAASREIRNGGQKPLQEQVRAERKIPAPRPIRLTPSPKFQPRVLVKAQPQIQTNPYANSLRDSYSLAEQNAYSVHSLGPPNVPVTHCAGRRNVSSVHSLTEQNACPMRSLGLQNISSKNSFIQQTAPIVHPLAEKSVSLMHSLGKWNTKKMGSFPQRNAPVVHSLAEQSRL